MKIGIFGGSFNPIHYGHLFLCEYVRDYFGLDKIIFVPVGIPTHRKNDLLSEDHRLKMIELSIKENKYFEVSDIEFGKKSYTIDTLIELKKNNSQCEFYEIIGEDSADYIDTWKDYEKLIDMAKFVVICRQGSNFKSSHKNFLLLDEKRIDISSTEIRERIKNNRSIKYMVTKEVEDYIKKNEIKKLI